MTELEVLYKLERAYSRRWWQVWIPSWHKEYSLFELLLLYAYKEGVDEIIHLWTLIKESPPEGVNIIHASGSEKLQTIRSAIAKLNGPITEKGNLK